jgi:hypothetical protein
MTGAVQQIESQVDRSTQRTSFLSKLFCTKKKSDVLIHFNDCPFDVHHLILALRSTYFKDLLFSGNKEKRMVFQFDFPLISHSAFNIYLDYCYGSKIDPIMSSSLVASVLCLAVQFQVDDLKETCWNQFKIGDSFTTDDILQLFEYIFPILSLIEDETMLENVFLVELLWWFTHHLDKIVELDVKVLSLIPEQWLRYVFGKAPIHFFEDELGRLNKAIQLYEKLKHCPNVFSALFEDINYKFIPMSELWDKKYLFLYRTENVIVRDKIMSPRGKFVTSTAPSQPYKGPSFVVTVKKEEGTRVVFYLEKEVKLQKERIILPETNVGYFEYKEYVKSTCEDCFPKSYQLSLGWCSMKTSFYLFAVEDNVLSREWKLIEGETLENTTFYFSLPLGVKHPPRSVKFILCIRHMQFKDVKYNYI